MLSRFGTALLFVSLATAIPLGSAVAQQPVCLPDVQKFCSNVPPGGARTQACLREHDAELSKECRARLDDLVREAGLIGATCRWDIAHFCSDVAPGGGRLISCLESHTEDLNPECKDQLKNAAK